MQHTPIFVISLARASERRADISRRLQADGLQYEIVNAVDGRKINRADYADRLEQYDSQKGSSFRCANHKNRHNAPLNNGEIGCYLSHYNLWRRIADEKIPAAVILEDDAVWNSDFAAVVAEAAACDWEWDLIQLCGSKKKRICRVLQPLNRHFNLVQYGNKCGEAAAYLISLPAAKKLIKHCYLMHHAVDMVWQDYWNWNGRMYAVRPYPVFQQGGYSTIADGMPYPGRQKAKIGFWAKLRYFLIKHKYSAIGKFYFFWVRPKRK